MQRSVTCAVVLAISGCHGGASGAGSGSSGGSGTAGAAAAKPTDEATKHCAETALVTPRALGKGGNDMYRALQIDPVTKDIYAADLHTVVRIPAAGGEPVVVVGSEAGVGRRFWLRPDRFLFPGDDVLTNGGDAVLFSMPREGGELTPIIPLPAGDPSSFHRLSDVRVIGDDVYWQVDEGIRGKHGDSTHTFFTTSWKEPGTPRKLFASKHDVGGDFLTPGFVIAGSRGYILEKLSDKPDAQVENVIDLATGAVSRLDPALGGFVISGDAEWLIVRRMGTRPEDIGAFRMKPDGSQALRISENLAPRLAMRNATWALVTQDIIKGIEVSTMVAATGARKPLGCVNGNATLHATAFTDDAVYLSVFRDSKAMILRFAL